MNRQLVRSVTIPPTTNPLPQTAAAPASRSRAAGPASQLTSADTPMMNDRDFDNLITDSSRSSRRDDAELEVLKSAARQHSGGRLLEPDRDSESGMSRAERISSPDEIGV
jgi:hypothetical protein